LGKAGLRYYHSDGGTTTWTYTNIGLVSTISLNSGSVTTHTYDSAGQTTGITHKKANDTIIEQLAYTYDNAGNRKTVTENSGDVTTWTYDNANQLTVEQRSGGSAYHTTFTYDNVGNRETMVGGTDWTATGAGTAGFNGQYADDGTYRGKTAYKLGDPCHKLSPPPLQEYFPHV